MKIPRLKWCLLLHIFIQSVACCKSLLNIHGSDIPVLILIYVNFYSADVYPNNLRGEVQIVSTIPGRFAM